jgi:signal peptidase I
VSRKVPTKLVLREYIEGLIVAVVVALFLRFFVVSVYRIPTSSMAPTLRAGDLIIAYKLPYGIPVPFSNHRLGMKLPRHGDVVVFRFPGDESIFYVKRVIGLPGERIEIRNKKLYINEVESTYEVLGQELIRDFPGRESYQVYKESFAGSTRLVMNRNNNDPGFYGPIVVPPGQVFVLGDNRDSSDDSRYWGTVPGPNIEARVLAVGLSLNWLERWGNNRFPSLRWERVLKIVD